MNIDDNNKSLHASKIPTKKHTAQRAAQQAKVIQQSKTIRQLWPYTGGKEIKLISSRGTNQRDKTPEKIQQSGEE